MYKNDNNSHVTKYLKYYCNLSIKPGYAVMLKGPWGCGKTFYIDKTAKKITSESNGSIKFLYVSLYGLNSTSQIEDEFFKKFHPVLSSKYAKLTRKVLNSIAKATIKFDLDGDRKDDGSLSVQIPELNINEYLKDTEDYILVFDDIERCSINLSDLLGYINHFVEHQGSKVIIVADEDIITGKSDNDPSAKDENDNQGYFDSKDRFKYKKIKEKLVGKTFSIFPYLKEATEKFIEENQEASAFLLTALDEIINVFNMTKSNNLRILKYAIWDFERLYKLLDEPAKKNKELLLEVLSNLIVMSSEIKINNIMPNQISYLSTFFYRSGLSSMGEKKQDDPIDKIIKKYPTIDFSNLLPEAKFWEIFFDKGLISIELLTNSITNSKYFYIEKKETWLKLWYSNDILDKKEFDSLIVTIDREIKQLKHTDIGVIKHIWGMFLFYSHIGLYNKNKEDIVRYAEDYVNQLKDADKLPHERNPLDINFGSANSHAGLVFQGIGLPEFKRIDEIIKAAQYEMMVSKLPEKSHELLNTLINSPFEFTQMIFNNNRPENKYFDVPILKFINVDVFINAFMSLKPKDRKIILESLYLRYLDLYEFLSEELEWMEEITKKLDEICLLDPLVNLQLKNNIDSYLRQTIIKLKVSENYGDTILNQ